MGDWHTCAMPLRAPPRSKVEERAEWDAWVASEVRRIRGGDCGGEGVCVWKCWRWWRSVVFYDSAHLGLKSVDVVHTISSLYLDSENFSRTFRRKFL